MNTPKDPPVINSFSGLAQSLPDQRAVEAQDDNGKIDYQRFPVPETIARSNERGSGDDSYSVRLPTYGRKSCMYQTLGLTTTFSNSEGTRCRPSSWLA